MTEYDIRGIGLALMTLARQEIAKEDGNEPNAEILVDGVGKVLMQAFVDLNRIAGALEHMAVRGVKLD